MNYHYWFCKWFKWQDLEQGKVTKYDYNTNEQVQTGIYVIQKRTCIICGRLDLRTVYS